MIVVHTFPFLQLPLLLKDCCVNSQLDSTAERRKVQSSVPFLYIKSLIYLLNQWLPHDHLYLLYFYNIRLNMIYFSRPCCSIAYVISSFKVNTFTLRLGGINGLYLENDMHVFHTTLLFSLLLSLLLT